MSLREVFLLTTIHIIPDKPLLLNAVWKSLSVSAGPLGGFCLLIRSGTLSSSTPAMVNIVGDFYCKFGAIVLFTMAQQLC